MGFFRRKQVRAVQIKVPEEGYKFSYSRTLQRVEAEKQRQGNQEGIRTFEGLEYKPYELKEETKPKEEVLEKRDREAWRGATKARHIMQSLLARGPKIELGTVEKCHSCEGRNPEVIVITGSPLSRG